MKFYSEMLTKIFNTEAELVEAETAEVKKKENKDKIKQEILAHVDNICTEIKSATEKLEQFEDLFTEEDLEEILSALIGKVTNIGCSLFYTMF